PYTTLFRSFRIDFSGTYQQVLHWDKTSADFINAKWFEGISLSYAEHIFRNKEPHKIALKYADEKCGYQEVTWQELQHKVSVIQQFLLEKDVQKGDRVVGILNNTIETVAIFLAVNALGAIWSCCSPDFGDKSIIERF